MTNSKNLYLVQFSLLLAIEAIVCFTPLGSIPAGPIVMTLGMIPVIITGILLGVTAGAAMGFITGLFSFCVWTFMPPQPIAFVFTPFYSFGEIHGNLWSLVICFVPRILVGVVAAWCFNFFKNKLKNKETWAYLISGFLGSMANTLLVTGGIYLFFGKEYASVLGIGYELLLGIIMTTIFTSGMAEAVLGALAALGVCRPMNKYILKHNK